MEKTAKTTPRDFFLWLASVAALYVSVVSLVALWFEYIDRLFGNDPFAYIDPLGTGVRIAVASLIIIFPLYIWFTRMLHQDMRENPEKKNLWVRRWLLVLTLFVGGIVLVVDLIVLINTFLGGEVLTAAFLLKVLTVLVVVGGAFVYYVHEIKGTWEKKEGQSKMIAGVVSLVVLASVVSAFFIVGSPQTLRALRYDQQKVSDLQNIQWQVTEYWRQKEALPANLEELKDPLVGAVVPTDPQFNEGDAYVYEYRVISQSNNTFELCAVFNRGSIENEIGVARPLYSGQAEEYWTHGIGRTCFERTVDPEKFPPLKEIPVR